MAMHPITLIRDAIRPITIVLIDRFGGPANLGLAHWRFLWARPKKHENGNRFIRPYGFREIVYRHSCDCFLMIWALLSSIRVRHGRIRLGANWWNVDFQKQFHTARRRAITGLTLMKIDKQVKRKQWNEFPSSTFSMHLRHFHARSQFLGFIWDDTPKLSLALSGRTSQLGQAFRATSGV
jgi:hypothetical protein